MCTHYLHNYFFGLYFRPLLSTPSYRAYVSWESSDTYTLSVYLDGLIVKYISKDPPPTKTICLWNGANFVISALQYIIVMRETYKYQIRNYYRSHGVNEYIYSQQYLFLCKPT